MNRSWNILIAFTLVGLLIGSFNSPGSLLGFSSSAGLTRTNPQPGTGYAQSSVSGLCSALLSRSGQTAPTLTQAAAPLATNTAPAYSSLTPQSPVPSTPSVEGRWRMLAVLGVLIAFAAVYYRRRHK